MLNNNSRWFQELKFRPIGKKLKSKSKFEISDSGSGAPNWEKNWFPKGLQNY